MVCCGRTLSSSALWVSPYALPHYTEYPLPFPMRSSVYPKAGPEGLLPSQVPYGGAVRAVTGAGELSLDSLSSPVSSPQ